MTPLTELSNDELNRRLAEVRGLEFIKHHCIAYKEVGCYIIDDEHFTPATDKAQCMELLIEGKIVTDWKGDDCVAYPKTSLGIYGVDPDPLRAIVIAFIKMRESK